MTLPDTETLSIREMCDTYQVTARTLRFYEAKELLSPIRAGSRRLYTKQDRARLQLILRGKRFGFSLEDIRQLLDMYNRNGSNQAQLARTFDLGQLRLAQMKAQRDELSIAIAELETELNSAGAALAAFRSAAE
jgi:DNA-binding transcriptional MerR regulator